MFKVLFLLSLMVLGASCGKVDRIDVDVQVNKLGDGEHFTQNVVVPLSEKQISSFTSPVAGFDPLVRGFMGSMMGLGASIGAGKTRLTLQQPIPDLPEGVLSSVKIKRVFFYMDVEEAVVDPSLFNIFRRKEKANFDFLRSLLVKVSAADISSDLHALYEPIVATGDIPKEDLGFFRSLFRKKNSAAELSKWEADTKGKGKMMIGYHQDAAADSLRGNDVGAVRIVKTEKPALTRKYLEQKYSKYVRRVHTLNKSILVELHNTKLTAAKFEQELSNDSLKIEELEIGEISPCTVQFCLDFKVEDVNLINLVKGSNALQIDAYIDPKEVPKSFQLKGFLEFEVKIKTKI